MSDVVLIENAQKYADELINTAKKEQAEVLLCLENELRAKNEAVIETAKGEFAVELGQAQAKARLESAKSVLKAKQEIVDRVFDDAAKKILELPEKKYLELLERLIAGHGEHDDTVVFARCDTKRVLKGFVEGIAAKTKLRLKTSEKVHEGAGGIVLEGKNYDKNFSIEALIDTARQEKQGEVLKVLFND